MKILLLIVSCIVSSSAFALENKIIKDCEDCHGKNGISFESDVPTIAGASAAFMEATLFTYQDNTRPVIESKYRTGDTSRATTDMKKIADQLTDQQISDLSEHYASLPFVPAKQSFDATLVTTGKKIHERKCRKCHEDGGSSAEDDAGILAGQWTPYLQESMKHFRDGSRETDKKMKKLIDKLNEEEWSALLAFYASQQD